MNEKATPELRRAIGLPHATAMVVGIIIGASIFVQPSEITGQVPSVPGVFLVWLISGMLTFFGALVCAELASIFIETGGVYVYLKEAYSPSVGFLWGWAMFWIMHSGIIAAISVIFARYVAYFYPLGGLGIKLVAIAVILLLSIINYLGVKHGSRLQLLFTLGKVLAVVFIIVAGFILGSRVSDHFVAGSLANQSVSLHSFFLALVAGLFAFGGWHMVTYNSEETIDPQRTIPRALMLGTLIVTLCYIAMNAVYMYVLPLDKVASSTRIAADAANTLIGFGGGAFMSGLVIFSTFGALNGIILCGPRVYYSMAQDGLLFRWVGEIHPKHRTPY
ncbi:MAG: amino acid permease, partial [Candidatus Aminicenantaceae bacterium]